MSDWYSLLRPPYIYLILGVISFFAAVVWTCTGRARTRFQGWVYPSKEPTQFWWVVAMYYLGGVLFMANFCIRSTDFQTELIGIRQNSIQA
jgi:H+/Cl- antiporter ClcA